MVAENNSNIFGNFQIDWDRVKDSCEAMRCMKCGKVLAVGKVLVGYLELLCKRCNKKESTLNPIEFADFDELDQYLLKEEESD